jgi:chromosomal replication initiation ATPase DnaA
MNNSVVDTNVNQALSRAKEILKNSIPNEIFWKEFVNTIELAEVQNNQIFLKTKNLFAKHVITNEYTDMVTSALNKILQANFTISFVCAEDVIPTQEVAATPIIQGTPKNTNNYALLNPNYLFSNFIVGEFNKTAYNAAQSLFKKVY